MRVKRDWDCRPGNRTYTIQEAVMLTLSPSQYGQGQLEELEDRTSELVTFVSRLFEMLVERGAITPAEALEMIRGYTEVTEEEGTR